LTEIFQLRLLGPFQINGANPAIPQRAKGLIAYLAMHAGRSISREVLATLLWSYSASQQARQSLRQCLTDVRVTLGRSQQLETSRSTIRFTPAANADIDVHHFEVLAQSAEPDELAAASELYRGEFLEGLDVNSEPFVEWLRTERSRLASAACDTLRRLALLRSQAGDAAGGIAAAQRLLSLDPLREDGHRILMELYAAEGRRSDALRQFASCREIMRRELGVEPDRETLVLVARIKTGAVVAPATSAPTEETGPLQPTIAVAPTVRPDPALSEPVAAESAGNDIGHVALPGKPPAKLGPLGRGTHGRLPLRWLSWGRLSAIAGALCLAVFAALGFWHPDYRLLSEDGPSIVVMPFRALGDKGQAEVGESIADGLARELSQLPGAQIVSSETARTYSLKSLGARQIRRELGAAYIVAGSLASAQPGLHAEGTLLKTLNDTVIRPFAIDVAETDAGPASDNIVTGLIWPLTSVIVEEEGQRAAQKPVAEQTANDLVWLGWSTINRNLPYANSVEALSLLENARRIDKKNVDALALMANILITQAQNNPKTGDYQSKLSAAEALLAEAQIVQPSQRNVLVRYDWCLLRRAQARYEEALGFCRTLVDDLYRRPLAYKEMAEDYLFLGKLDQAIAAFATADHLVKRAPVRWTWLAGGGWAYLQAGNYEEAINWLRQALAERPRAYRARVWLIAAYALSGRQQDAATELAELQRAQPELFSHDDALARMINTPGSSAFGENMRRVIEGLEKGGFPERMTKPLLAKTLVPVGAKNSAEGNASQ
jgi:DNA-binding SARP family transcriptional activator/TolB-like protein